MVCCNTKSIVVVWQLSCSTGLLLNCCSDRLCRSAWDTVSGLSEESAREQYVGLVAQFFPKWNDECTSYHPEAALAGPVFSSLANSKECAGDLSDAAVCAIQQMQMAVDVPCYLHTTF